METEQYLEALRYTNTKNMWCFVKFNDDFFLMGDAVCMPPENFGQDEYSFIGLYEIDDFIAGQVPTFYVDIEKNDHLEKEYFTIALIEEIELIGYMERA